MFMILLKNVRRFKILKCKPILSRFKILRCSSYEPPATRMPYKSCSVDNTVQTIFIIDGCLIPLVK